MLQEKKETISESMGISDEWFDETSDLAGHIIMSSDKVSEVLEKIIVDIRLNEFGTDHDISDYEKKLILAGYVVGSAIQRANHDTKTLIKALRNLKD
jgi:hypothetical protein